jgi:hypothetical protein
MSKKTTGKAGGRPRGENADEALALALATGATGREAADTIGCSVATVARRKLDPAFMARVRDIRADISREVFGGMVRRLQAGLVALDELLVSPNEHIKLGALRTLLEYHAKFRDATDHADRLEEVERRLGIRPPLAGPGDDAAGGPPPAPPAAPA